MIVWEEVKDQVFWPLFLSQKAVSCVAQCVSTHFQPFSEVASFSK